MKVYDLAKKAMRAEPTEVLRSQMIICALATSFPLLVGLSLHELPVAIYGSLAGYLLTIFDLQGPLSHRLAALTVTFGLLVVGFLIGLYLQSAPLAFYLVLAAMSYWVGVLGGQGAELERALLFATFQIIIAANARSLGPEKIWPVFAYGLCSFAFVVAVTVVHKYLSKRPTAPFSTFVDLMKQPIRSPIALHLHALSYMVMSVFAAWLMDWYSVERGYWTVITVMLVMKPDRTESLFRSFQRLLGTCLGALVSSAIIMGLKWPLPIVLVIGASAFFVPWAMKKNYWIVAFFISVIVILLLDLADMRNGDFHMPLLRLRATAWGSGLGVIGVGISKILSLAAPKIKNPG